MHSTTLLAVLTAFPLALATSHLAAEASTAAAPSGTATGQHAVQTVQVGADGLKFTPDDIKAAVGSQIVFEFSPKNHSVVQADFDNPCNPAKENPIFSGFFPVPAGTKGNQTFTITVEKETPIWLYCSALMPNPHCKSGMVAVINAPANNAERTLETFRKAAAAQDTGINPTQVHGGVVGPRNGGSASPSGSGVPSGSPGTSPTSSGAPESSGNAAAGMIVPGSAVGGLLAVFAGLLM